VIGESGWSHGPCIVSKFDMSLSDTVYYYRHTFTVIGSLILIITLPLYGKILCIFITFLVLRSDLYHYVKIIINGC
jgi:hypothetical protein